MAALENEDAQLKTFEIDGQRLQDCTGRGEEVAAGAYGFVYEVKVDGINRIAKKPHAYFRKRATEADRKEVVQNFKKECVVLSKLRHPNIVQFIGVTYENNDRDNISMIMERMECDLANFVRNTVEISLATKLLILQDVSFGLVYLHESNPPILHRDLTARNILLTRSLRAKIADVGVAKLMDPATMAATAHTTAPGQAHYMPPEALKKRASYSLKLDSFSFGHLCLHTILEDFPEVCSADDNIEKQGTIEKLRRQKSLDEIGEDHIMCPLIIQCLHDNPDKRPTARELNDRINAFVDSGSYIEKKELEDKLQIQVLSDCREKLESRLKVMEDERERQRELLMRVKANLTEELDRQQESMQGYEKIKQELLQTKNLLELKGSEVSGLQKERQKLKTENATMKDELEVRKLEISIATEDFEAERKDRERMASEKSDLKGTWEIERQEWQEKIAQINHEKKDIQIDNVSLKRELEQLHSGKMKEYDQGGDYLRLLLERDEIERQRKEYEKKYGNLMDSYSKLRQLALDHSLKVPKREECAPLQTPHRDDMNVKIFNPAEYNLPLFQQDPNSKAQGHSKHAATELVSSGPHGIQIQQHAHPRPGSQKSTHLGKFYQKSITDELAQGIDQDISETPAQKEGGAIETSLKSLDDAEPLDSKIICRWCKKQFQMEQIQNYIQHFDNCSSEDSVYY